MNAADRDRKITETHDAVIALKATAGADRARIGRTETSLAGCQNNMAGRVAVLETDNSRARITKRSMITAIVAGVFSVLAAALGWFSK